MNDVFPHVRVIVPAFNKADLTTSCLRSLLLTAWPHDRFDLVVVDNGSSDDTAVKIRDLSSDIHVVSLPQNRGFAGGCNAGISATRDDAGRSIGPFDYVALINNDAFVDPAWLAEMIAVAEANPDVGAVSAKILLAPKFSEVVITPLVPEAEGAAYVEVRDVVVDGTHQDDRLKFGEVFVRDPEPNVNGRHSYWFGKEGAIRIVDDGLAGATIRVDLELSATSDTDVHIRSGPETVSVRVPGRAESIQVEVLVLKESFDVVNSAGGEMYRHGFGGDRGYLERDSGQFADQTEIFSWCGAGALIRRSFLDEVGMFDPRLFLYYEDFDLSWRGRLAGWRYLFAPKAVIRHHHAQTSVEGSELFRFFTTRNRLLVLAKNAPSRLAIRALIGEIKRLVVALVRAVMSMSEKARIQQRREFVFRSRVVGSFFRHVPWMLLRRWTMVRRMERDAPLRWTVDKRNDPGFVIDGGGIQSGSTRTRI